MQDHHLQKQILHKLVLSEQARFAELRPPHVDSNVFTYHLKQLIKEKLVAKTNDGMYSLTPLGRVAGINVTLSKKELLEQAHSVILMALKTKKEGWLLRKRLAQPMYQKVGFTHAEPLPFENALTTAQNTFQERTGLICDFKPAGFGFVRLYRKEELESFVHFNLLIATSYKGDMTAQSRNGENAWYKDPDFTAGFMIPSMAELVAKLEDTQEIFYADLSYQIS